MSGLELNRIYQRDCIEGMRLIPDDSVNLIVIDPPYNIGKDKRWDKYDKDEYEAFMSTVFSECERVLKSNGSFYWFHNDMAQIRQLMDAIDNETTFIFKQLITWNKIDPTFRNHSYVQQRLSVGMRNYYNGFTEYCLFYTFQPDKNETQIQSAREGFKSLLNYAKQVRDFIKPKYSRQYMIETIGDSSAQHFLEPDGPQWKLCTKETYDKLIEVHKINEMNSFKVYDELYREYEKNRYTFRTARVKDELRANSNVWLYPPAKNLGHITPKPLDAITNIILHSSNEGDVVLDCFMGSGTTAVAALRNSRNFIGFETEPEYVRIANQRLESLVDTEAERKLTGGDSG
jgi:DNA modification methylase